MTAAPQPGQVPFDELLARASDEAREFDRRVVAWAADRNWTTYTRATHRNVLDPSGRNGITFFPDGECVQVGLRELIESGDELVATTLLQRLEELAGRQLSDRLPKVPVAGVLQHWNEFFDEFLPHHITAMASA